MNIEFNVLSWSITSRSKQKHHHFSPSHQSAFPAVFNSPQWILVLRLSDGSEGLLPMHLATNTARYAHRISTHCSTGLIFISGNCRTATCRCRCESTNPRNRASTLMIMSAKYNARKINAALILMNTLLRLRRFRKNAAQANDSFGLSAQRLSSLWKSRTIADLGHDALHLCDYRSAITLN